MAVEDLVTGDPSDRPVTHRTGYDEATTARLTEEAAQIVARYPDPRSALLPLLHLVQSQDGYVSPRGVAFCATRLGLTAAQVSAVATFYTQYKRHPNGTYTVGVCVTSLCAVMGGDAIWDEVSEHLGIGEDETTADGSITLERVECNAACDYAPVVMVNWEFFDNQTPAATVALVDDLQAGRPVRPSRGAEKVASFREVEHVLAGFPDGLENTGTAVAAPTLRGTVLARQKGWTAPPFPSATSGQAAAEQAAPAAPATAAAPVDKPAPATKAAPRRTAKTPPAATTPPVGGPASSAQHPEPTGEQETHGTQAKRRTERKES